jgi:hypothetical protein
MLLIYNFYQSFLFYFKVLFKVLRMPPYDGPTNMKELKNSEEFLKLINPKRSPEMATFWCVEFYANSVENCITVRDTRKKNDSYILFLSL